MIDLLFLKLNQSNQPGSSDTFDITVYFSQGDNSFICFRREIIFRGNSFK